MSVRLDRHARHVMLKEIGGVGQQRLDAARVALVGLGGLGAPAALYLAAAGVGRLTLIDDDTVDLSNLQRQILYAASDVGALKADKARGRLKALDPDMEVDMAARRLTDENAVDLLRGCDVVLDGSDSFETRFAVNRACMALGLPLVSGAVGRWEGQLSVFRPGGTLPDGRRAPCYQCLHPAAPETVESCAVMGIVGALPGIIGSAMALEAIKLLAGAGQPLLGRVWRLEALSMRSMTLTLAHDPACPACAAAPAGC